MNDMAMHQHVLTLISHLYGTETFRKNKGLLFVLPTDPQKVFVSCASGLEILVIGLQLALKGLVEVEGVDQEQLNFAPDGINPEDAGQTYIAAVRVSDSDERTLAVHMQQHPLAYTFTFEKDFPVEAREAFRETLLERMQGVRRAYFIYDRKVLPIVEERSDVIKVEDVQAVHAALDECKSVEDFLKQF